MNIFVIFVCSWIFIFCVIVLFVLMIVLVVIGLGFYLDWVVGVVFL